jgi:ABC-type nitrate/sulfonate/bicarbonate transport system permease component
VSTRLRYLAIEIGATAAIIVLATLYVDSHVSYAVVSVPAMLGAFRQDWLFARFGQDIVPSLERMFLGYFIGVIVGATIGMALGLTPVLRLALQPVITFLRSIPAVALLPIAVVLLGIGNIMKISVIAFVCVWPVLLNMTDGVISIDRTLRDTAHSYMLGRYDRLRSVVLPAAGPQLAAGMRMSLSLSVLLLVAGEMVGSSNGIGYFLLQAQQNFAIANMWAAILLLGLLGWALNTIFSVAERRVLRWYFASGAGGN